MKGWRYRLSLAGACILAWTPAMWVGLALGESGLNLVRPAQVMLYLHAGLKDTDFVEPLLCALKRVLVAPVEAQRLDLPLGPELLATPISSMLAR